MIAKKTHERKAGVKIEKNNQKWQWQNDKNNYVNKFSISRCAKFYLSWRNFTFDSKLTQLFLLLKNKDNSRARKVARSRSVFLEVGSPNKNILHTPGVIEHTTWLTVDAEPCRMPFRKRSRLCRSWVVVDRPGMKPYCCLERRSPVR